MVNQFKSRFIANLRSRFGAASLALALIIGSGVAVLDADPALADPCPSGWTFVGVNCERTYVYTGAAQTFSVPAGVRNISFVAAGARGGMATSYSTLHNTSAGAVVSGVLPLSGSAQTIQINVGGTGVGVKGGFNGGGDGALYNYFTNMPSAAQLRDANSNTPGRGGGGGGATDIRVGGTGLSNRVLVAGGGGGAALYYLCYPQGWLYYEDRTPQNAYCTSQSWSSGGSATNEASATLTGLGGAFFAAGTQGGQATATAGGVKGALAPTVNWVGCDSINYSTAGSSGLGGHAGALQRSTEPNYRVNNWNYESCPAGGGGGGYFGGGGAVYGGGGGGSSFLSTAIKR
jgi:hypothetical protein